MKVPPLIKFPPVGKCIYCGATEGLQDEHIVPFSFGGHHLLEQASCADCGDKTGADEGHCCNGMLRALRVHHKIPTRNPKSRPTHLQILEGETPHGAPMRNIPVDEAPGVTTFPIYGPPVILLGHAPTDKFKPVGFQVWDTTGDGKVRTKKLKASGLKGALAYVEYKVGSFERVLAKIAHGYFISQPGSARFRPLLEKITTREDANVPYLVGGIANGWPNYVPNPMNDSLRIYQIVPREMKSKTHKHLHYLAIQIRLFSHLRPLTPVYLVVAGEKLPDS